MRTNEKRTLAVEELSPKVCKCSRAIHRFKSITKEISAMLVMFLFIGIIGGMERNSIPMTGGTIASLVCLLASYLLGRSIQKDEI